METVDRRAFLRKSASVAGAVVATSSLSGLIACNDATVVAPDGTPSLARAPRGNGGYGPISMDPGGLPFLIPAGFTLRQISKAGDPMVGSGSGLVPNALDSMGAFQMANGNVRLIRNHEIRDGASSSVPFGVKPWDAKAGGGGTSLEVSIDPATNEPTLLDEFVSISGTTVNCAGGITPWGSWLTCEETTEGTGNGRLKDHGYVFEVPASATSEVDAVSLNAMGRFSHEAVAVDPTYGHVYQTEDAGTNSGFYRFIPNVQGNMAAGGTLQMLAIVGRPQYNTTNGTVGGVTAPGLPVGVGYAAEWVTVDEPDPAVINSSTSCFGQGFAKGGARFARLEGCWWGDNSVYFNATSGGAIGAGQVFQYRPTSMSGGVLTLIFESPNRTVLDAPDNICVSPRGGIVICEDGGGGQFLRGLTSDGRIFDLLRSENANSATEFAGACFSPDGRVLFFNSQGSTSRTGSERGGTFVLWGPWASGAL